MMSKPESATPPGSAEATGYLGRGREQYERRAWAQAYQLLSLAARSGTPLTGVDLEYLSVAAYLTGRDDEYLDALDRAHHEHARAGDLLRAVRCAFWLGLRLQFRGEAARASGWLGRAKRLLERVGIDCAEQGYLLLAAVDRRMADGDAAAALEAASSAAAIGERFAEPDLSALARHLQGRVLIQQGRAAEGLALLDEAMVAVTSGELSPLVTGLIYCSVIDGCQEVRAMERAREWTSALARWCDDQPDLVAFTGVCQVHRAEIMQLNGAWDAALEEARRAAQRCLAAGNRQAAAAAYYQQAEVRRLRGEFQAAEEAYASASQWGWEPQPGLALLRLAQGRPQAAAAAMRRVISASTDRLQRSRLLPAHVEVMLSAGDLDAARAACGELERIAQGFDTKMLDAIAADARGALELAARQPHAALAPLRRALHAWQSIEAPYLAARTRALLGLACRALGDEDGARLDLAAAQTAFAQLGAAPDLARIDPGQGAAPRIHGLTARELQVLRLVAAGKTNKTIARELDLSERTVDRHLSNIFGKLDVPSRAAATAYAYQHRLM
jgi:DNA-binding NarL/FixJ family response regulator